MRMDPIEQLRKEIANNFDLTLKGLAANRDQITQGLVNQEVLIKDLGTKIDKSLATFGAEFIALKARIDGIDARLRKVEGAA